MEIYNEPNTCQSCKHFVQHYVRFGRRYSPINAGHCVRSRRVKNREALAKGCEYWTQRDET